MPGRALRPDLVLYNANVITLDERRPRAELVAVRDERIVWVGSDSDLRDLASAGTKTIDCSGQTIVPGFIDAHTHVLAYSASLMAVDCRPSSVASIAAIQRSLRERAETAPAGQWVRGTGYDEFAFPEGGDDPERAKNRHPTRWDLDQAVPHHPVRLDHRSGHACVLNSMALALVGISSDTPEPPGGTIARDLGSGGPNGLLLEMDEYLDGRIPPLSDEELEQGIRLADRRMVSLGITSVHDATPSNSPERWDRLRRLKADGMLRPRVTMMAGSGHLDEFADQGFRHGYGDHELSLGHVKLMLTMSSGQLQPSRDELTGLMRLAYQAGFPVAVHAVEAEAVDAVADAISELRAIRDDLLPNDAPRDRIEHCSEAPPATLARLEQSGAVVVTQPAFLYHSGRRYLSEVPQGMRPWLYRMRSFLEAGLHPAAGSDAPVVDPNPLVGMCAAVTRRSESGEPVSVLEGVPPNEALKMYTLSGAYAAGRQGDTGSIEVGKLADLALLDGDPTRVEASEIRDIKVRLTVIGGQVVWEG
jgi:predicted amidohydrolase YtcJ